MMNIQSLSLLLLPVEMATIMSTITMTPQSKRGTARGEEVMEAAPVPPVRAPFEIHIVRPTTGKLTPQDALLNVPSCWGEMEKVVF